jgi:membrane protease YdiL (CAAX protease family)
LTSYPPPSPSAVHYAAQPQPNPVAAYEKGLRGEVLRIVVAAVIFRLVLETAVPVVVGATLLLDGTLANLISLAGTDFDEYLRQFTTVFQNSSYVGLAYLIGMFIGVFALLIVRGKRMFTEDLTRTNERMNPLAFCKMLALVLGFGGVLTLLVLLLGFLLELLGFGLPSALMPNITPFMSIWGILYVAVCGPIFEEVMFRGAVLRALQPYGNNFAIVLSSLLFGLYHLVLFQGVFAFFVGLVFAYCALRFSIKWSMLLHLINNSISMIMSYLGIAPAVDVGLACLFIALALVAAAMSLKEFRQQKAEGKFTGIVWAGGAPVDMRLAGSEGPAGSVAPAVIAATPSKPYKIAFSSPWLIALLVLGLMYCALILLQ